MYLKKALPDPGVCFKMIVMIQLDEHNFLQSCTLCTKFFFNFINILATYKILLPKVVQT